MKKIIIILASIIIGATASMAQCSDVLNNFEIKLVPVAGSKLKLQIRHTSNGVPGAKSETPIATTKLDGLIFAISYPTTSNNIEIVGLKSDFKKFNIAQDVTVGTGVSNKVKADNVITFFHDNITLMPEALELDWTADKWYDLATVTYKGNLQTGDFFSLLTCDYGLAHPNSYVGNSTTDPWFALYNNDQYLQYSPKMITEMPTGDLANNSCSIYPVPTNGALTIEIESNITTQVAAKVIDNNGKIAKIVLFEITKGKNINQVDIGELVSGNYMIQITDGKSMNFNEKIIKN
jgi:Secretion system C-terminal sorting domain